MAKKAKTIIDQLKQAIRESGLTNYRIAKDAGVAQITLDRFVSGERDLRGATLAKLAKALGLELTKTDS